MFLITNSISSCRYCIFNVQLIIAKFIYLGFVFQDFTGVPAVVDLAAMRDAMKNLNNDPNKINPLVFSCFYIFDLSIFARFNL